VAIGISRADRRFLRNISYHEAGHTAAYGLLGMPVVRVTIERVVVDGFTCEGFTWRTLSLPPVRHSMISAAPCTR
jgi:hypothetical protein